MPDKEKTDHQTGGIDMGMEEATEERLRSLTVNPNGRVSVWDPERYLRNSPELKRTIKTIKALKL